MASVNKWIGIGNLTRDPEVRHMTNGEAVTNCSIACNEQWKSKDGEKQERVEYVNLVFYRRLAEIAGEYLKKGSMIYVDGKLQTKKWQDKEGKDRYTTEIIVNEMTMLSGKSQGDAPARRSEPSPAVSSGDFGSLEDNIPFAPHGKAGAGVSWRAM